MVQPIYEKIALYVAAPLLLSWVFLEPEFMPGPELAVSLAVIIFGVWLWMERRRYRDLHGQGSLRPLGRAAGSGLGGTSLGCDGGSFPGFGCGGGDGGDGGGCGGGGE